LEGKQLRILVVDDDSMITDLLEGLLTDWGHEPVVFNRSPEALAALTRQDAPQLVVLDWNMPFIDGLSISQSIRRREDKYTYVIILTGNSQKQHVLQALQSGVNDYIVKPFSPDDLKARIEAGVRAVEAELANKP
jgi:DNA-binding response OmpR family regulator